MNSYGRTVLLISPSLLIVKGIEGIFADLGEFELSCVLTDLSRTNEIKIKNIDPDIILIDPIIFDYTMRADVRNIISQLTSASVIALQNGQLNEEQTKQFDDIITLYDEPTTIIRKLRQVVEPKGDESKLFDTELSSREKDILICVAKGMLNKEIADKFSISIYTVITHRKNITRKTGIKTVAGLTVYALLNNLVDINSFE